MSGESTVTAVETTETNHNSVKINSKDAEESEMELQILAAMRSCVTYLRNKADCFTLGSLYRLMEEDLRLEKYALDVHKSFVKKHLVQCLEEAGKDGGSEISQETEREDDATPVKEVANASEEHAGAKKKDARDREALMSDIMRALRERASYIKANSEKITMALLRRLLEQDLRLEKDSLDPFKKFINKELDVVLQISDAPELSSKPTEENIKSKDKSTQYKKVGSEEDSYSDSERDVDNEEGAVKKTMSQKRKLSKSEKTGKRKCENDKRKKKAKRTETDSGNEQKKETATGVYGKRVEHLKSVIKSCGLSVPPVIYRIVKRAPEEKRGAILIEKLEKILAKEGLSTDPLEKEIKEVRKRKDISKELEGIDTTNIVSSSRRRSTTSFATPSKPKITSESESDRSEDSENGEDNKEANEEAREGSQSEEESNNENDGGEESE